MPQLDYYALWSQFFFVCFFLVVYLLYEVLLFPLLLVRLKVPMYVYQYLLTRTNKLVSAGQINLVFNNLCVLSLNDLFFCSSIGSIYVLHHFVCYPVDQLRISLS